MMALLLVILSLLTCFEVGQGLPIAENVQPETVNFSADNVTDDPNKEMYVIHAMVYQVGILTNKTEDDANDTGLVGNQESLTFYHSNGSNVDLSGIPEPLVTNVTAQRMVGVAPIPPSGGSTLSWSELKKIASSPQASVRLENHENPRHSRDTTDAKHYDEEGTEDYLTNEKLPLLARLYKRSLEPKNMKDSEENKTPVKIVSGSAVIPQEVGVQSIAIPALLTLNNKFSEIPVPIPNTSVVQYAKVNTLLHHTT